jgi:hypothetical protein
VSTSSAERVASRSATAGRPRAGSGIAILVIAGAQLMVALPAEVFRRAATARLSAAAVDDMLRYFAEYEGRTAQMSPDLQAVAGHPAMTFAEWATGHAASFR